MTIAEIVEKMIAISEGNTHDINHFLKVWAYAKAIGNLEGLDEEAQYTLEAAALVHDIACPLCRVKYGNTNGKYQETESEPLIREFFAGTDVLPETLERIIFLVSHHHTPQSIDGIDYQILIEADYIVNADESAFSKANIINFRDSFFATNAGKRILNAEF